MNKFSLSKLIYSTFVCVFLFLCFVTFSPGVEASRFQRVEEVGIARDIVRGASLSEGVRREVHAMLDRVVEGKGTEQEIAVVRALGSMKSEDVIQVVALHGRNGEIGFENFKTRIVARAESARTSQSGLEQSGAPLVPGRAAVESNRSDADGSGVELAHGDGAQLRSSGRGRGASRATEAIRGVDQRSQFTLNRVDELIKNDPEFLKGRDDSDRVLSDDNRVTVLDVYDSIAATHPEIHNLPLEERARVMIAIKNGLDAGVAREDLAANFKEWIKIEDGPNGTKVADLSAIDGFDAVVIKYDDLNSKAQLDTAKTELVSRIDAAIELATKGDPDATPPIVPDPARVELLRNQKAALDVASKDPIDIKEYKKALTRAHLHAEYPQLGKDTIEEVVGCAWK